MSSYNITVPNHSPTIRYAPYSDGNPVGAWGLWSNVTGLNDGQAEVGSSLSGASFHISRDQPGASFTLAFTGSDITLYGFSNCTYTVSLDNATPSSHQATDASGGASSSSNPSTTLASFSGLDDSKLHSIVVTPTPGQAGQLFAFSRAEYKTRLGGSTTRANAVETEFQAASNGTTGSDWSEWAFVGDWKVGNTGDIPSTQNPANYVVAQSLQATATFTFWGRSVALYGSLDFGCWAYDVTLDGQTTLYNASSFYLVGDSPLFVSSPSLDPTIQHSIAITSQATDPRLGRVFLNRASVWRLSDDQAPIQHTTVHPSSTSSAHAVPSASSSSSSNSESSGHSSFGMIIGGGIVAVLVVVAAIFGLFFFFRRRSTRIRERQIADGKDALGRGLDSPGPEDTFPEPFKLADVPRRSVEQRTPSYLASSFGNRNNLSTSLSSSHSPEAMALRSSTDSSSADVRAPILMQPPRRQFSGANQVDGSLRPPLSRASSLDPFSNKYEASAHSLYGGIERTSSWGQTSTSSSSRNGRPATASSVGHSSSDAFGRSDAGYSETTGSDERRYLEQSYQSTPGLTPPQTAAHSTFPRTFRDPPSTPSSSSTVRAVRNTTVKKPRRGRSAPREQAPETTGDVAEARARTQEEPTSSSSANTQYSRQELDAVLDRLMNAYERRGGQRAVWTARNTNAQNATVPSETTPAKYTQYGGRI